MSQYQHLYGRRWKGLRAAFLQRHPFCTYCQDRGIWRIATVVDHIIPHQGDLELFYAQSNWQPLCKRCHDSVKQREEATGRREGCDVNGVPIDPNHHWRNAG
jgi:5-methylcytosine-specific restriction endonuclease McrA